MWGSMLHFFKSAVTVITEPENDELKERQATPPHDRLATMAVVQRPKYGNKKQKVEVTPGQRVRSALTTGTDSQSGRAKERERERGEGEKIERV